jgi:cytoplasmic tRNA 2-thiolation protein 2
MPSLTGRPVDPSATAWKAQASLTSLPGRGSQPSAVPVETKSALAPLLCYACLTTFTPLSAAHNDQLKDEAVPLPLWVGERASQHAPMSREDMKAQVSEFLLE